MFRKMRRYKQEINKMECLEILKKRNKSSAHLETRHYNYRVVHHY